MYYCQLINLIHSAGVWFIPSKLYIARDTTGKLPQKWTKPFKAYKVYIFSYMP